MGNYYEKYIQSDWIGEDKTAKSDVDLKKLINMQKTYISTLEEGINLRDKLIERYEIILELLESYRDLVKLLHDKINDLEVLLDLTEKSKENYKELYLKAHEEVLLLKNTPKGCSTCKHVYCRGDREPCISCNRCIINHHKNNLSDKWEPKVCDEMIEGLQSEINASRKDDSHSKA